MNDFVIKSKRFASTDKQKYNSALRSVMCELSDANLLEIALLGNNSFVRQAIHREEASNAAVRLQGKYIPKNVKMERHLAVYALGKRGYRIAVLQFCEEYSILSPDKAYVYEAASASRVAKFSVRDASEEKKMLWGLIEKPKKQEQEYELD